MLLKIRFFKQKLKGLFLLIKNQYFSIPKNKITTNFLSPHRSLIFFIFIVSCVSVRMYVYRFSFLVKQSNISNFLKFITSRVVHSQASVAVTYPTHCTLPNVLEFTIASPFKLSLPHTYAFHLLPGYLCSCDSTFDPNSRSFSWSLPSTQTLQILLIIFSSILSTWPCYFNTHQSALSSQSWQFQHTSLTLLFLVLTTYYSSNYLTSEIVPKRLVNSTTTHQVKGH